MNLKWIGDVELKKIVEMNPLSVSVTSFFPSITRDIIKNGRGWLPSNFLDPTQDLIFLSFHSYVLKTAKQNILVDTCNGNCKTRDLPRTNMLQTSYLQELSNAGFRPEDIDVVLCTHLHPDHVGWNTILSNGRWVPTFPNARYLMGRTEYEYWEKDHTSKPAVPILRGAFIDSILPIMESGQAMLVDVDHVVEQGHGYKIWLESSPGHSPGHVCVNVKSGDDHAVLSGDAVHHALQLSNPELWTVADFNAAEGIKSRRALLECLADTPIILLTAHFPFPTAGYVVRHKESFRFKFY